MEQLDLERSNPTTFELESVIIPEQWSIAKPPQPLTLDLEPTTPKERQIAALVLSGLVGVLDDRRSLRQLEEHISLPLYSALANRERKPGEMQQGWRLRTLHTFKPRLEVIEASGTAANGQSARAVAARFHQY